jgi:hypothetical protein
MASPVSESSTLPEMIVFWAFTEKREICINKMKRAICGFP